MNPRTIPVVAFAAMTIQAIAVLACVVAASPVMLPVTADFGGGILLAQVNLGLAAVVLLAFSAVCQAIAVLRPSPLLRRIEWSQLSAITVFLIAQLNGVSDVSALVPIYALTASAALFLVLHDSASHQRRAFAFGAAVGIVSWGVVAFYQVGAIVAGADPAPLVRVITLAMLIVAGVYWAGSYRLPTAHGVLVAATTATASLFAWLVVAGLVTASL